MTGRKLNYIWRRLRLFYRSLKSEDLAGVYITVIAHLTVIIVLLSAQIGAELQKETSFVIDFSDYEEQEQKIREENFKESISRRLDEMLANMPSRSNTEDNNIRNLAVDASTSLKDDRNTDAEKLYRDAENLQKQLDRGKRSAIYEDASEETVDIATEYTKSKKSEKEYSGPSVLSYTLDGRKASHLKIPAYRCYSGGEVTVIITVDPSGRVINAKVLEDVSSDDQCLRDFAIRAARLSWFSKSSTAPARQTGEIVYRFLSQ